jgi:multidrug efflux pump subunit AcrA (membrane-fusion protein)
VYVVRGDVAKKQTVQAGTMSDGMLLIQSGLAPGDRVIDRGAARVVDGERVALIES